MKGIDLAKWNGQIDWKKVKEEGVSFAILKIIDKAGRMEGAFEENYKGARAQGIPVGVYNYSYATTVEKAINDAKAVIELTKGREIEEIWIDVEDACQKGLNKVLIDLILAYGDIVEKAGFRFGIYTGLSFYNVYIKPFGNFIKYPFWIARYPSNAVIDLTLEPWPDKKPVISHELWGWQYSSKGRVSGIQGNVDLNIRYNQQFDQEDVKENAQQNVQQGVITFSRIKNGEEKLAPNFLVKEFACKDGTDQILTDPLFIKNILQNIRDHFGKSVVVNSAYRTPAYNRKIKGEPQSYHLEGRAFDISIKTIAPVEIARYAQSLQVNGIIQYNTFVHLDSRKNRYWAKDNGEKRTIVNSF